MLKEQRFRENSGRVDLFAIESDPPEDRVRPLPRWISAVLVAAALVLFGAVVAKAQELNVVSGVICNTREQLVSTIDRYERGEKATQAAMNTNTEYGVENACGAGFWWLSIGEIEGQVKMDGKTSDIKKVLVFGMVADRLRGLIKPFPKPLIQHMAFARDKDDM